MAEENSEKKTSLSIRSILSQVLAGSAQNLLLLDLGMAISFSTLVIPALLGVKEGLSFTVLEASWFGSINSLLQPIGSVFSGMLLEPLGRKRALLLVNIPHIIAWLMLYFAQDVATLFCANALLGLGTGFMEAPILTYVGEISHPAIRGTLTASSQMFVNVGVFAAYFFGLVMHWRTAAACCLVVPLATFVAVLFIPETPVWLLSKGRKDEALKALCWVRGWTQPANVQNEFDDLVIYQERSILCHHCTELKAKGKYVTSINCTHYQTGIIKAMKRHFNDLFRKEVIRPLTIIILMFFFQQTTGIWGIRPNMVNVFNCFGMTINGHIAAVATGAIGVIGAMIAMSVVKQLGKRVLAIGSLLACSICTLSLGIFAYINIPYASSYEKIETVPGPLSWIPMLLFGSLNLFGFLGINGVAWLMLSEIFPLRGRGMACGIGAAFCYIISSIVTKTYYDLELAFHIYGAMWFYSCCSITGVITLYLIMPETEGKSLEEIENQFVGKRLPIIANDKITNQIFKGWKTNENTSRMNLSGHENISINVSTIDNEMGVYKVTTKSDSTM